VCCTDAAAAAIGPAAADLCDTPGGDVILQISRRSVA
jgi:hypothetical protein